MLEIVITSEVVGESILYELKGKQGRTISVPTYKTVAVNEHNESFVFAVTRDTSDHFFLGETGQRYDTNGECPPNLPFVPYHGRIRTDSDRGFRISLYEPGCSHPLKLRGRGPTERIGIAIHRGPARSEGCFLVAEGDEGHERFTEKIRSLISKEDGPIRVTVLERQM